MCVICVAPPGYRPDRESIIKMATANPDGSGYAIRANRRIVMNKDVEDTNIIVEFDKLASEMLGCWKIWHSRIATHGQVDAVNAHPFIVPKNGWAMAHNGILNLSDPPGPNYMQRSDSRILAEEYFPRYHWNDLVEAQEEWEEWISPSKVVLLSPRKERGGPCLILGESDGKWLEDGCWYSNNLWEIPIYTRGRVVHYTYRNGDIITVLDDGTELVEEMKDEEYWRNWDQKYYDGMSRKAQDYRRMSIYGYEGT